MGMCLSGIVPWNGLPAWMYHGQEPPPTHEFNASHPGITWVDLVFPFFLTSMGAAIPLAQSRAIEKGTPWWRIALNTLSRYVLLVFFAIFVQHIRPESYGDNRTTQIWLTALLGFVLAFPVFVRLPASVPSWAQGLIRALGWGVIFLAFREAKYADGVGIDLHRSDIIILVLSNMALWATAIWLITRGSERARWFAMGVAFMFALTNQIHGSLANALWSWHANLGPKLPLDWAFNFEFCSYLVVLMPGTIIGDLLLKTPDEEHSWSNGRQWAIGLACFAMVPISIVLFYNRLSAMWTVPFLAVVMLLVRDPVSDKDHRLRKLIVLGCAMLALGCLAEPFEGGIKKDPMTLSYLMATPGLAALVLSSFLLVDPKRLWMRYLSTVGQNPMVAYIAITNLLAPLWALSCGPWIENHMQGPYLGMLRALLQTFLLGLIVAGFSKLKLYLRA